MVGLGHFGDGPFRRWCLQMFYKKKVLLKCSRIALWRHFKDWRKTSLTANSPYSRTTINRSSNGVLVEGQSLARVKGVPWLGLTLTLSCFRKYSDKKNSNNNLKSLTVVFTCNTEHTLVQYCITFLSPSTLLSSLRDNFKKGFHFTTIYCNWTCDQTLQRLL